MRIDSEAIGTLHQCVYTCVYRSCLSRGAHQKGFHCVCLWAPLCCFNTYINTTNTDAQQAGDREEHTNTLIHTIVCESMVMLNSAPRVWLLLLDYEVQETKCKVNIHSLHFFLSVYLSLSLSIALSFYRCRSPGGWRGVLVPPSPLLPWQLETLIGQCGCHWVSRYSDRSE